MNPTKTNFAIGKAKRLKAEKLAAIKGYFAGKAPDRGVEAMHAAILNGTAKLRSLEELKSGRACCGRHKFFAWPWEATEKELEAEEIKLNQLANDAFTKLEEELMLGDEAEALAALRAFAALEFV